MNNEKNITALLDIITEQRQTIAALNESLATAKADAKQYKTWWLEDINNDLEKTKAKDNTEQS